MHACIGGSDRRAAEDGFVVQVLALLTMEKPLSLNADDVRDEKVKLLRSIKVPALEDTVLGQYTAHGDQGGYLDDPTVPPGSKTPTFASIALHIDNDRHVAPVI